MAFFWLGIHQLACRVQPKRTQVETQYWGYPEVARLEGTPAIHVTCLYISWDVRESTRTRFQKFIVQIFRFTKGLLRDYFT